MVHPLVDLLPSRVTLVRVDTAVMPPSDREAYWHDVVRQHITRLDCKAESSQSLLCSMEGFSSERGAATRIRVGRRLHVRRPASAVDSEGSDAVICNLVLAGAMQVEQSGTISLLQTGDFALCTADRPYTLEIPSHMDVACFRVPQSAIGCGPTSVRRLAAHRLGTGAGMARLLKAYALALIDRDAVDTCHGSEAAMHHLALLLGAAVDEVAAINPARGTDHRERLLLQVREFIARHIDDSALSVAAVAAAMRISTRYLQQLWSTEGGSLAGHIAATRLERVAASLGSAARAQESLTQIAMSHGFNNMSHFSRAFRERFGTTPSSFRAERTQNTCRTPAFHARLPVPPSVALPTV